MVKKVLPAILLSAVVVQQTEAFMNDSVPSSCRESSYGFSMKMPNSERFGEPILSPRRRHHGDRRFMTAALQVGSTDKILSDYSEGSPSKSGRQVETKLCYRNEASSGIEMSDVIPTIEVKAKETDIVHQEQKQVMEAMPRFEDLPYHRHAEFLKKLRAFNILQMFEMALGRFAMISAIVLFIGEITTGMSIIEQIATYF